MSSNAEEKMKLLNKYSITNAYPTEKSFSTTIVHTMIISSCSESPYPGSLMGQGACFCLKEQAIHVVTFQHENPHR